MKFERLTVPDWPLPDLVAFNQRVHERIDPWWQRRWVRRGAWGALGLFTLFAVVWLYFASGLPSSQSLLAYQPPLPTNVRGFDGTPVQTFARERRVELSYDEFPPLVRDAFISAEDKTFFTHGGLDYLGLVGAVGDYAAKTVTGGGRARGGSTITQQVAKYLLKDSSYNIGRKIREAILAFRLESTLSKQQILELYLNSIFLGRNAYGVQAAARAYFDKDVTELTLPEAAYLAVLPKAPANYDPVRATQRALDRRNYVLREMRDNGYITEQQRADAAASPLGTIRYGSNEKFRQQGGYFMEDVRANSDEQVRRDRRAGPQQRLCRRAMGPNLDGSRGCRTPRPRRSARVSRASTAPAAAGSTSKRASTSRATGRACWTAPRSAPAFPTGARRSCCRRMARKRGSASATVTPQLYRVRRP